MLKLDAIQATINNVNALVTQFTGDVVANTKTAVDAAVASAESAAQAQIDTLTASLQTAEAALQAAVAAQAPKV